MTEKVNAITVFAVNYKESDKILTLFTLEKGKIVANARGVRKVNAKHRQVSEPFCFAEVMLAEKSGRRTVTEVNAIDNFYPLRQDLAKYYAGTCALEFTDAFMQEEMVDGEYFALLLDFLKNLAYGDIDPKSALVGFLSDAVNESGYSLNLAACGRCGAEIKDRVFLSVKEGFCCCEECRKTGEKEFSFSTYSYLKRVCSRQKGVDSERAEDPTDANNALRFFGYYVMKVADVNLKCLTPLINL